MKKILENTAILTFVFGWGVGGTILWLLTGDANWLWGWLGTLIILLAG